MKDFRRILTVLFAATFGMQMFAQREDKIINQDWSFRFSHQVNANAARRVDLPHTWNAQDALGGKQDYKRGIGNYTKRIFIHPEWQGKRLFLRFEGANSVSNVFVNGKHIGEHRGGYGAFIFEITDKVEYGKENTLLVRVNNGEQLDVMPLVGDFNFYGGIYRDVHLLLTDNLCISPLDYASSGLYLIQQQVTDKQATVCARVNLSNGTEELQKAVVRLQVNDGGKTVYETEKEVSMTPHTDVQVEDIEFVLKNPRLWNGTQDPFMYQAVVTLIKNGKELDKVEQPLGLRYYTTDPDKGFFLNGKHLPLHGVCRHQERAEVGNALHPMHHEEDTRIMLDMGVNAVRLAHYPQATYMYDLMDKNGFVTWAEIPFVGPGGYADKGFVDQLSFRENGKEQLKEMIRQHYNHPSICFWGLFNELKEQGDNPVEYIKELNVMAHREDPTRPTTSASNQDGALNFITDNIAWNRYDGWYGATPATLATWLDATHKKHPQIKIAISEYGAGASIYHQQDSLVQTVPGSWWHPENWQTEYHIQNWKIINERPYVWGSFVWNMFDFGAAHRTEGDRPGVNDKGLVTHDRKIKKDAYYFYRANWNLEPMVYIAGRRNVNQVKPFVDVRVFSNVEEVILMVNGRQCGKVRPDSLKICLFKDVPLTKGSNKIEVRANDGKKQIIDQCTWILQ
ncbi:glycoside hydrolase family 2 TIM barrel-domain containing protein [Phocaeicola sp.]|uniref:beta-glucuronidase LacZ4 n=1 Tax=Phocaeicola sp. TaxID=2773926 RepID=UPI0023C8047A|nr:glycoside hydrolase family 2 TIM barrel-domain containing protein [Phocaeicola sp.]MDE5678459.1 glycoside hydrolase family 2 protein [Phocaeicola sp.]